MTDEEFFGYGSDSMYGHVDGPRPESKATAIKTDPFESVLAMCRVMGLHYRIVTHEGKWICSVGSKNYPGDFWGCNGDRTRIFTVVNCDDRLSGLISAISMAWNTMRGSCDHWRDMVSHSKEYSGWFRVDEPKNENA